MYLLKCVQLVAPDSLVTAFITLSVVPNHVFS